jgi:hypothetical protein
MRKGVNKKIYIGALLEYSFFEKELKKEFKYGIKVGGNYYFLIKSMNINIESFFKILKSIDMFKVKKYSHFRYNFLYKTKIKFFKFGNFFVSLIGNFSSGNKFSISNKNIKKGNKFFLGISFMYNNYFYFKI